MAARFSKDLFSVVDLIPDKNLHDVRKTLEWKQNEAVKAHYLGAVILVAAATGFLVLVYILNRAFDFSCLTY